MKKQLFSLMMAFALVVGLSVTAMAQTGMTPATAYEVAIGFSTDFSVTPNATSSFTWGVGELAAGHTVGAALTTGSTKVTITNGATATATIRFNQAPDAGNIFVVQCIEQETSDGGCSTIRRFYVSVFNFDVEVIALGTSTTMPTGAAWLAAQSAKTTCNSWDNTVVKNTMDAAAVAAMHQDSVNNPTDADPKVTDSYFALRVHVDGSSLDRYKARINWSMPGATNISIYSINVESGAAGFSSEGGAAAWTATPTTALTAPTTESSVFNTQQTLYLNAAATAVTELTYLFKVTTHNLLGQSDMVYDVRVDRIQLEKAGVDTDYNNGEKVTATSAEVTGKLDGVNDITSTTTIYQTPATSIIDIAD